MENRRYIPHGPLSAFVNSLWYWEGAPQTHWQERLLPTGEAGIVFNLRESPLRVYDPQDFTRCTSYGHALFSGARSNC